MTEKINNRGEWSQEKCGENTPPKSVPSKPSKGNRITEGYVKKGGKNDCPKTPRPPQPKGQKIINNCVDVCQCEYKDKDSNFCLAKRDNIGDTYTICTGTNCYYKQLQRKTAECEGYHNLAKKYLADYFEVEHKLQIATEALEKIANQNFNTPNRICNLAEEELVPCTNNCKYCLQAYAQRALE